MRSSLPPVVGQRRSHVLLQVVGRWSSDRNDGKFPGKRKKRQLERNADPQKKTTPVQVATPSRSSKSRWRHIDTHTHTSAGSSVSLGKKAQQCRMSLGCSSEKPGEMEAKMKKNNSVIRKGTPEATRKSKKYRGSLWPASRHPAARTLLRPPVVQQGRHHLFFFSRGTSSSQ